MGSQHFGQNQQVSADGYKAMNPDRPVRCGPRKHQQTIDRHELVRPHQSRHTEDEIELHNHIEDETTHGTTRRECQILLDSRRRSKKKRSKTSSVTRFPSSSPDNPSEEFLGTPAACSIRPITSVTFEPLPFRHTLEIQNGSFRGRLSPALRHRKARVRPRLRRSCTASTS